MLQWFCQGLQKQSKHCLDQLPDQAGLLSVFKYMLKSLHAYGSLALSTDDFVALFSPEQQQQQAITLHLLRLVS